ncbi:MAG: hypothetical protein JXB34_05580 [Bacteroidales bacterium]|nr:hypothetical protein [Bacteroidales bacterium]
MKKILAVIFMVATLLSVGFNTKQTYAGSPAKVEVKTTDNGYKLYVNGEHFIIKGAGLEFGNIEALAAHGANAFRTWRTENGREDAMAILDKAHENGLMVLMGLEVGRERHGHDYNDTAWVKKQFEYLKGEVLRLKDHPALLGWAIGNELNLGAKNLNIYNAVNDISKMIHEIDPNHPTTTTLAGIRKREVDYIKEHCSDIDFLSIQMYGDIINLQKRIADAGWDGPYMVTEWGATGHWEVSRTEWGASIEQTSKEKAAAFIERYRVAIEGDPQKCIGSFVFVWEQKQERTPTWYGMFTENGEETETVDAMHFVWNDSWPANRCPTIDSLRLNGNSAFQNIKTSPGAGMLAEAFARDYDNDTIRFLWELLPESTDLQSGGDKESRPVSILKEVSGNTLSFKSPIEKGAYRIFVYALDGHNHAATANIPFYVE